MDEIGETPPISEFVQNSPGIEIHREMLSLQTSLEIQIGNYEAVVAKHAEFRNYSAENWKEINPIDLIKDEYYRPFHNYVTSIYTVTKHSQRIVDRSCEGRC